MERQLAEAAASEAASQAKAAGTEAAAKLAAAKLQTRVRTRVRVQSLHAGCDMRRAYPAWPPSQTGRLASVLLAQASDGWQKTTLTLPIKLKKKLTRVDLLDPFVKVAKLPRTPDKWAYVVTSGRCAATAPMRHVRRSSRRTPP